MNQQEARMQAQRLVGQMTVEEKLSQLLYNSPAIARLGIHEYNWWNEASHGVARAGTATVFPHAIALAATFDPALVKRVGDAVSTEARAKYNKNLEYDDRDIYKGLTFWTPNINIFRDPRWGRGQETFGEDPYLTAVLGMSYIQGLQGDGEFLKSAACSKHFAGHSGPERLRHGFDARISDHDLWETYLPAFEWTVKSGVAGVMGAYNRTNGEPCCASRKLIQEILLGQWNFDGYFVSDCGAIADICLHHHYTDTMAEAAAAALKTGCNLNCGEAYTHLMDAYEQDLITEEDITDAAVRLYTIRFRLGEFETERPYRDISFDEVDSPAHNDLNLEAAENAVVLLENKQDFLPIRRDACGTIAVIGPNAQSVTALEGNYNGRAAEYVTLADGVRRVFPNARIRVSQGSNIFSSRWEDSGELLSDALAAVSGADLTVLCLGYDRFVEGEELGIDNDCFLGGDRRTLRLPKVQTDLAEAVCQRCENVVIVVMSGSAIDLGPTLRSKAKAILHAWYPGALGGLAVARILSGDAAPGGRLPVTFYREENPLPDFEDYSMAGRTYRYLTEEPLYPFGYGLNYGHAALSDATAAESPEDGYLVSVRVRNEAARPLTEKIQVYARFTDSRTVTPNYQLCGVQAVTLAPGEERTVSLSVDAYWLKAVDDHGNRITPDGEIMLYVGTHQPDARSAALTGTACCAVRLSGFPNSKNLSRLQEIVRGDGKGVKAMKIYSVLDPEFKPYGQVVTGMQETVEEILSVLRETPQPEGVGYVPEWPAMQELPAMVEISEHCYGGMPIQLGWCNGHNTKLNCLEYHRDSEFNLGTEDFVLLLAKQDEIVDGTLDTARVKAFRVPAGVLVEVYATTLHYAPCHCDASKGFRVLVALPQGTNTDKPVITEKSPEDRLLRARNKWLLAHPDSKEAAENAYVGLTGENLDIADII